MLVRNESVQKDAHAMHSTRSESGILTPNTNGSTESRSNSRKRKIEQFTEKLTEKPVTYDLLNEDFSVKVRFNPPSCHILRFVLTRCAGIPFISTR